MEKFNSFEFNAENVIGGLSLSVVGNACLSLNIKPLITNVKTHVNAIACPTPVVYCPPPVVCPCPPATTHIGASVHVSLSAGLGLNH